MTQPHSPDQTAPAGPSVLVVDDDPDIQRWAAAILEPQGCRIAKAEDVLTGLMMVRRVEPDVIVLDVHLPGGGGKVFLERLRKLAAYQKTPVLILSAELSEKVAGSLQIHGISGLLEKPVNPALFTQAVLRAAKS